MNKILVAYASKTGSTIQVAETIQNAIKRADIVVDLMPVDEVTDISPYSAAVIGSAIRMGQWLPNATAFVKNSELELRKIPVAYFVVCLRLQENTPETRQKAAAYLHPLYKSAPLVKPVSVGLFAGAMDYGKLPFWPRMLIRMSGLGAGDYRDWQAIRAWCNKIRPLLIKKEK